ncbi:hypothetical protein [Stenotrophomonas sp. HMWF003]|uniref:hypothetical protein n=1 Tax=Stenotrophomonas sp. HMWF003 TaxID=2056840 RepID=UPI000FE1EE05|nr:hypothetical protein [Stenotrophomonas sp. HMWF003]
MLLFYYCEGDPAVHRAEYSGPDVDLSIGDVDAIADAVVVLEDGASQGRVVDDGSTNALKKLSALQEACGRSIASITVGELLDASLRVRNWKAAIAAFHRCGGVNLAPLADEVESCIRLRRFTTLGNLVNDLDAHHPSQVIGAAVLALRARSFLSNLDTAPWSMHTRLMRLDHARHT